ncbi:hypothetical protein B0H17DRAFT_1212698 [Mycena rosella]|uniref:Uncharacterized protein n=1 Tax=Mycena rosella TaxID=1033263 RepID=A0AAD7G2N5_MYCRO|nr:hypothetical protein B0H17DRAFT_1212698 [Mycena rosella]
MEEPLAGGLVVLVYWAFVLLPVPSHLDSGYSLCFLDAPTTSHTLATSTSNDASALELEYRPAVSSCDSHALASTGRYRASGRDPSARSALYSSIGKLAFLLATPEVTTKTDPGSSGAAFRHRALDLFSLIKIDSTLQYRPPPHSTSSFDDPSPFPSPFELGTTSPSRDEP